MKVGLGIILMNDYQYDSVFPDQAKAVYITIRQLLENLLNKNDLKLIEEFRIENDSQAKMLQEFIERNKSDLDELIIVTFGTGSRYIPKLPSFAKVIAICPVSDITVQSAERIGSEKPDCDYATPEFYRDSIQKIKKFVMANKNRFSL